MDSLPRLIQIFSTMGGGPTGVVLIKHAGPTSLAGPLHVHFQVWPPHITSSKGLHTYNPYVCLMYLLQYLQPQYGWNDNPASQ